jgi:probable rRNA maturation factor
MGTDDEPGGFAGEFTTGIEIELSDTQSHVRYDPGTLERLVRDVLRIEGVTQASISLALVDDATIHEINRSHLEHDWPTDVITFPLSEPGDECLAGEIVVSGEMARTTAAERGHEPWEELALYVVHGLLHLRGYDDLTEDDARAMRRREDEVMAQLGLTNPFSLVEFRLGADESESLR